MFISIPNEIEYMNGQIADGKHGRYTDQHLGCLASGVELIHHLVLGDGATTSRGVGHLRATSLSMAIAALLQQLDFRSVMAGGVGVPGDALVNLPQDCDDLRVGAGNEDHGQDVQDEKDQ